MPRLLALAIEKGYDDSPIPGVRTRIAPKWLSALPIPPKISLRPPKAPLGLGLWGDYWTFILEHYFF